MKQRIGRILFAALMIMTLTACGSTVQTEGMPSMGTYQEAEGRYENSFLQLQCQLDENWEVYDAEQLAEIQNLDKAYTTDAEMNKQLKKAGSAQLFYAEEKSGTKTINIVVENMGTVSGQALGETQYAETGLSQIKPALESVGFTDVNTGTAELPFAGEEHAAIVLHAKQQDVDFYEKMICFKVDQYMVLITAGAYQTDATEEMLGYFTALSE